ncbi:MAG: VTT domain-containing protein [Methylotetracoccus sp.]
MTVSPRRRRISTIAAAVATLAIAGLPLLLALPFADWHAQAMDIKTRLDALGPIAPAVFTLVATLSIALGAPRLIFCTLGGMLFGFAWGFAFSQLATMLGEYLTFLAARRFARGYLLRRFPRLRELSHRMERSNWWSVILVRQMPISGLYNDILLGLSPVTHRDFWLGSALGFLPLGVTASLVGAGTLQTDLSSLGHHIALAAVAFVALSASWNWVVAQARKHGTT